MVLIRVLIAAALLLLVPLPALARDVLVVQSLHSGMYDQAMKGFRYGCPADSRTLVLSDYSDPELARVVQEERPRLVVALGDGALGALRGMRKVPVVAMMALGLSNLERNPSNLRGVELLARPEQYLALFRKMKLRRIGVVYDPARTGRYLRLARAAARQQGVELVLREVKEPRQVVGQLSSLKGGIDSLWLLPDLTTTTRETLEAYFLFAQAQSVPVISFSSAHLKLGAAAAVEVDVVGSGKQAGELAQQLLGGAQPQEAPLSWPRRVAVKGNGAVLRRFNYPAELLEPWSGKR